MRGVDPVVIPIRFQIGDVAVQSTTQHLGPNGVYVRCIQPPAQGAEVTLTLYLPGSTVPEELAGLVRYSSTSCGEEGFWADFLNPGERARRRVQAVIEKARAWSKAHGGRAAVMQSMAPRGPSAPTGSAAAARAAPPPEAAPVSSRPPGAESRLSQRHRANIRVRFASARDFVARYASDISAGGLFLRTDQPFPRGQPINLQIELPDGGGPVTTEAVVVHAVDAAEAGATGKRAGMGLQFVGGNDEFRARVDAFLDRLASEGPADEPAPSAAETAERRAGR